jgi:hypothetical protein
MKSEEISERFQEIAKRLDDLKLQRMEVGDLSFTEEDILKDIEQKRGGTFFLGFYSVRGMEYAFKEYGLYDLLEKKGIRDVQIEVDLGDPFWHFLRAYAGPDRDFDHLIAEFKARRGPLGIKVEGLMVPNVEVLNLEWLLMQNPFRSFSLEKPALPGQRYPGLGIGREVMEMLILTTKRLELEGLRATSLYYHNAKMYHKYLVFVNPLMEGKFLAMERAMAGVSFYDASWAVHYKCLWDDVKGTYFEWEGSYQLAPLSDTLRDYVHSGAYGSRVEQASRAHQFALDMKKYRRVCSERKDSGSE